MTRSETQPRLYSCSNLRDLTASETPEGRRRIELIVTDGRPPGLTWDGVNAIEESPASRRFCGNQPRRESVNAGVIERTPPM